MSIKTVDYIYQQQYQVKIYDVIYTVNIEYYENRFLANTGCISFTIAADKFKPCAS